MSNEVEVYVLFSSAQMVCCGIHHKVIGMDYIVSFVYGLNSISERIVLWHDICQIHSTYVNSQRPWALMGDFQTSRTFCGLKDLPSVGALYTWTNNRDENLIGKKLDRVLLNEVWSDIVGHSYATLEARCVSDLGSYKNDVEFLSASPTEL